MRELILELFSEEIPAMMQKKAEEGYKAIFSKHLQENSIGFDILEVFVGPRRITLHVTGLPALLPAKEVELKGPKIDAPLQAIEGFCRSNNIAAGDLSQKEIKGQLFYVYIQKSAAAPIEQLLEQILPQAIGEYVWAKSMYWGEHNISWVRPLKNILCLFDGKILPIKFGHLEGNNISYGHRFMSSGELIIKGWQDYTAQLQNNHVVLSRLEREELIKKQLEEITSKHGLVINQDERLLEEVTGLVEYPTAMIGKIPEKFLSLPSEVLVTSMKTHQKYFSAFDKQGNFAPYFVFISNMTSPSIVQGNEKVLSARLSDALYFYEQDKLVSLEARLAKLEKITLHTSLDSVKNKTTRIAAICEQLDEDNQALLAAAKLCKSDLVSEMVGEFPELQGIMGYYYAKHEGLGEEVASAIRDHYKPLGPSDNTPSGSAALLALADKMDNLVSLMIAGEQPTGSKDPYALRRQALGIIRIILERKIKVDLKELVEKAVESTIYKVNAALFIIPDKDRIRGLTENGILVNPKAEEERKNRLAIHSNRLVLEYLHSGKHSNFFQDYFKQYIRGAFNTEFLAQFPIAEILLTEEEITEKYGCNNDKFLEWKTCVAGMINSEIEKNFNSFISNEILSFLEERAKFHFKNSYDIAIINAVLDFNKASNLIAIEKKLKVLQLSLATEQGENLLSAYKRVSNILGQKASGEIDTKLFCHESEQGLYDISNQLKEQIEQAVLAENFERALELLLSALPVINKFFDNVMVKDEDPAIASNRLLLLQNLQQLFHLVADFGCL